LYIPEYKCQEGQVKCADGIQCISKYDICNKYTDCNDESDEDEDMCKGTMYFAMWFSKKYS